ncbi:hypothetical protein [Lentibacillus sp. Marseille-P4043]|uniref:hypothetical protein n=1 Tax=Lentibacillus sp. Marseille-P4043 TaxID=2040293 RepID=UPI000D0AD995|nr:hypothetical protein [Lentibacillus sp. Marseille-P4043]
MEFIVAYWIVGFLLAIVQKEPVNGSKQENSIFIFLLIFIVIAWPLFIFIRLLIGGKADV